MQEVSGEVDAPAAFTPGEKDPDTHRIRGWVEPSADLDTMQNILPLSGTERRPSNPLLYPAPFTNDSKINVTIYNLCT
jgi:hypothetical protein